MCFEVAYSIALFSGYQLVTKKDNIIDVIFFNNYLIFCNLAIWAKRLGDKLAINGRNFRRRRKPATKEHHIIR